ncbi:hypothetical protein V495_01446 [Pseudogymnoascus sp. VKM F-4514 (FW-929)]|nr:hypothetical protein V495_01446 [Pseudogymnoascus sp. VKM F-4514 (FW-929)]
MALPGFSINDLIDAAVQVKVVYDAFFHKYTNSATQLHDLIYEIHRFAQNLERSRDSFERVGVDDYDFRSIYNTLSRCQEFLEENKSILSNKKSPEALWRTARLPYSKEYIHLKSALQAHRGELTDRSVQYLVHKTTTPNNGLAEPKAEEVVATDQRRGTVAGTSYPVSPTFGGLQIPNLPTDSTIINNKYQYVTTPVSPSSRSLERAGFYHDNQTLSPPRPPSSFGPSPQNSPELSATDTIRSSISPRSSPVPPPSSRLSSVASPPPPCPELILPQPALDYVVAEILFGSKKIELKRKPAGRPSTSPTTPGRELVIINEKNEERVKHRIKLGPTQRCYPYTWNSGNHSALEVTFKGIPESNHTLYFKGKQVDLESNIPRYVFSNIADFTDFQSAVRNKHFLGAFAINKITSEKSSKIGDATYQHLKIWRDKETRQCSLSFYGSSLKRPRDLEFPFKYIKKEPESTKRNDELILRFDPLSWSQLLASSPSVSRGHNKAPSESEYTSSRHNTFSTVNTVSTDRTASTATSFFNFSRQPTAGSVATAATSVATITSSSRAPSFGSQNSDSGHSVTSDRPTTTPLEDLTRKMKFLKISFPDARALCKRQS